MKTRNVAFTLIELLTVIAIIGILAAILIPVVGQVREQSRSAKCISNLRQSSLGLINAMDDSNGRLSLFRETTSSGDTGANSNRWAGMLIHFGYVDQGAIDIFYCPSLNPFEYQTGPWAWRTYGLNMIDDAWGSSGEVPGSAVTQFHVNANAVEDHSRHFLLVDSYSPHDGGSQRHKISGWRVSAGSVGVQNGIHLRHGGQANMAFLDGHVERMARESLQELGFQSVFDENGNELVFPRRR